jgi:hypothetical protein
VVFVFAVIVAPVVEGELVGDLVGGGALELVGDRCVRVGGDGDAGVPEKHQDPRQSQADTRLHGTMRARNSRRYDHAWHFI